MGNQPSQNYLWKNSLLCGLWACVKKQLAMNVFFYIWTFILLCHWLWICLYVPNMSLLPGLFYDILKSGIVISVCHSIMVQKVQDYFYLFGVFCNEIQIHCLHFQFLWKMPLNCNRHHMESTAHFRKCGICAMLILLIHEHRIPFWLFFHQLQLYFIVFITWIFYSPWKNVYHK